MTCTPKLHSSTLSKRQARAILVIERQDIVRSLMINKRNDDDHYKINEYIIINENIVQNYFYYLNGNFSFIIVLFCPSPPPHTPPILSVFRCRPFFIYLVKTGVTLNPCFTHAFKYGLTDRRDYNMYSI